MNLIPEHAKSLTIDPHYYQIICRNGTRADRTGFDVDDDCALAHYIDSMESFHSLPLTFFPFNEYCNNVLQNVNTFR